MKIIITLGGPKLVLHLMIENINVTIEDGYDWPYSLSTLIGLTGIYGIHPMPQQTDEIRVVVRPKRNSILIYVTSQILHELNMVIHPGSKLIENESIHSTGYQKGVAACWVKAQTDRASQEGFTCIRALAFRDDNAPIPIIGYIVWGKLGYLLFGDRAHREFKRLMDQSKRSETTIASLLSDPEGLQLWIKDGFSWQALFDLAEDSESRRVLNEYLERKGYFNP